MLEGLTPATKAFAVIRLAAVSDTNVRRLLNRGISPESFPEIQNRLRRLNVVFEPSQLIDKVFEPSTNPHHSTSFPTGRFSNGDWAVFYSALEDKTSIVEVRYHQVRSGEFNDLQKSAKAAPRYFSLFETNFDGSVLDLYAIHRDCPELTSEDCDGYPRCRELAEEARSRSVDAFQTPSARQPGGTCTPVFNRQSLAKAYPFDAGAAICCDST